MNKDKKLRLLIAPLIFIIILFIPGMIREFTPDGYIQEMPDVLWHLFVDVEIWAVIIWAILFHYIPTGLYIVMLIIYTVVSWRWILKQKKGNALYFIVWLVLCVLTIFLYWKIGDLYYAMIHM